MMAAAQPFLSGAISQDGQHAARHHAERHRRRLLRGLAAGPQGPGHLSRRLEGKPAAVDAAPKADKAADEAAVANPRRERLPDTRQSITHKFNVAGHEGYITVGLYPRRPARRTVHHDGQGRQHDRRPDGRLRHGRLDEPAIRRAAGSLRATSSRTRGSSRWGYTKNPDIRIAKSLVDYIFRWLGITFLPGYKEASLGVLPAGRASRRSGDDAGPSADARRQEGRRAEVGQRSEHVTKPRPPVAEKSAPKPKPPAKAIGGATATLAPPAKPTATPTATRTATANGHANGNGTRRHQRRAAGPRRRHAQRRRPQHRPQRAIRRLPIGRPRLRQLRRHHRPQRQLLPLPQLRHSMGCS